MEKPAKYGPTRCGNGVVGALLLLSIAIFCGCAAPDARRYPFDEGWRIGWIDKIQDVELPASDEPALCAEAQRESRARVATVAYSHLRSTRYRSVRIPDSLKIERGDKVAVNIEDCAKDLVRLQPTS